MNQSEIPTLVINTEHCRSLLCRLGQQYGTDKSPLNEGQYRHAYTPIYTLLLSSLRHREINLAEIGIEKGKGLQLFRSWFSKAHIFGFEKNEQHIIHCKALNLENTKIVFTDADNPDLFKRSFASVNCTFDLIIDDGSHLLQHQLNTIRIAFQFLKSGGIMIIEDIFIDQQKAPDHHFAEALKQLGEELAFAAFIYPQDPAIYTGTWNNEKLLYLVKA